jgi:hypothetical protein
MGFAVIITLIAIWIIAACIVRIRSNLKAKENIFWPVFFLIIGILIFTYAVIIDLMIASGIEC